VTEEDSIIEPVKHLVNQFLMHQLAAVDLVRIIDELVATDRLAGLKTHAKELVEELHEAIALYVPDEATRREEPGIYIGEDELRLKAAKFINVLETSDEARLQ
jgi:hypothetical protein